MSEQSVDLLIIGDGVSARALLWELGRLGFQKGLLQVSDNKLFAPSSRQSTAMVALHGMKKGLSPLGDLLVDGVEHFKNNVFTSGLEGMERGRLIDTCPFGDERIKRRYGQARDIDSCKFPLKLLSGFEFFEEEAIFIEPNKFLSSLVQSHHEQGTFLGIEGKKAFFKCGRKILFDKLVLCSGVGLTQLTGFGIDNHKSITEVSGSFFQWEKDLGPKSFAIGLGKSNLVYRASERILMLGGTTQKKEVCSHDGSQLNEFYEAAKKIAEGFLPSKESASIFSGTRVKGPKRLPLFEEIQENVFILGAAHKNGWSQAFYGASKISPKLI